MATLHPLHLPKGPVEEGEAHPEEADQGFGLVPVSYTHLTLPTILLV